MTSVIMNSGTPTEFLLFPLLPPELRQMVWDEAIPTLGLQRFEAEIAPHPNSRIKWPANPFSGQGNRKAKRFLNNRPESFVLCLTPNNDFIQLTSGYLSLLSACRESRGATMARIKCHLPIHYIACDTNGWFAVRSAKVPFNPDGHICISGLAHAFTILRDIGARGRLAEAIQCPAFHEIKNLVISVKWPQDRQRIYTSMLNWPDRVFDNMAKRMSKLETVALANERVLDDRHRIDVKDFESLQHNPARAIRASEDGGDLDHELDDSSTIEVPWREIFDDFIDSLSDYSD